MCLNITKPNLKYLQHPFLAFLLVDASLALASSWPLLYSTGTTSHHSTLETPFLGKMGISKSIQTKFPSSRCLHPYVSLSERKYFSYFYSYCYHCLFLTYNFNTDKVPQYWRNQLSRKQIQVLQLLICSIFWTYITEPGLGRQQLCHDFWPINILTGSENETSLGNGINAKSVKLKLSHWSES